jgi:DNA-binding transcriptional MocR family regulator
LKALYAPRLQACLDELDRYLPDAQPTRPEGGFFLSVTFPEGVDIAKVREKAKARSLNLASGEAFFPSGGGDRFLRLPYCALTADEIAEGIKRLAETVREVQ